MDHGVVEEFKKMKRDLAPFNQWDYLICQWYAYLIVSPLHTWKTIGNLDRNKGAFSETHIQLYRRSFVGKYELDA